MVSRLLTQYQRNALLRFEVIYEDWRQATEDWLAAEALLWTEALRGADPPELGRLGAEAARLRDGAREAYLRVVDALMQAEPH